MRSAVLSMEYDTMIRNKFFRRQLGLKKANRVLKVWRARDKWVYRDNPEVLDEERQRLLKTRKGCSCLMCGNRREWAGDTLQEIKADMSSLETE